MNARVMLGAAAVIATFSVAASAQRAGAFSASRDHPAIAYTKGPVANAVAELDDKIRRGEVRLTFDPVSGYLRSLLAALDVPVESQVLVYSQTSFQSKRIDMQNPRAVYFNDRAAVGFVRGGDILEIAAQDRRQGMVFYQIEQRETGDARPTRNDQCLSCHLSWETLGVPGAMVLTVRPRRSDDEYSTGGHVDHMSPIAERWGGWYVTGSRVPRDQLGNMPLLQPNLPEAGPPPVPARTSLEGMFDLRGYPTPYSDVVALMLLEHQTRAINLITRAGWEFRQAAHEGAEGLTPRVREAVDELVDYLLFVDEAPLPAPIRGRPDFAAKFAAKGRRDSQGRSLRELELDTRLMRHPCSYMIESPGFEGLPEPVKAAALGRIGEILAGRIMASKYRHLTPAIRADLLEILRPVLARHFL